MLRDLFVKVASAIDVTRAMPFPPQGIRKVLVVKLDSLGDIIQVTPSLRALKAACAEIHYLCSPWVSELVDMIPYVDKTHVFNQSTIGSIASTLLELRKEKFDLAVNFHRDVRSNLLVALTGARYRAGFNWKNQGVFLTNRFEFNEEIHESQRYLSIVEGLGFKHSDCSTHISRPVFEPIVYDLKSGITKIGLFPGGGKNPGTVMTTKRWPVRYYIDLCGILAKSDVSVYLFGGEMDDDVTEPIVAAHPEVIRIRTSSLKEFAYYCAAMNIFVAGDVGPLHIAAALGVRTIGLFGPTSPALVAPPGKDNVYIWKRIPCSPCYLPGTVHAREFLKCSDNVCMKEISPDQVSAAITRMMGNEDKNKRAEIDVLASSLSNTGTGQEAFGRPLR
jgi:ADP-heptose:LPS heptosyltransferase